MYRRYSLWLFMAMILGVAACAVTQAATVPLSDLLEPGATFTSGDKIFSEFTYLKTGDTPEATGVNVTDIEVEGNYGIRFQGGFIDQVGGDASDALITFNVSVPAGSPLEISDAHLYANPAVFDGPGLASITETFLPANQDKLVVYDFGGEEKLIDSVVFAETYKTLPVQKDIILHATGDTGAVTLSFVDQTFSQVPEPSSLMLIALGLLSAGFVCRRR